MKKVLCMLLCLCMMISIFTTVPVSAAYMINGSDITVTAPKAGEKPIASATTFSPNNTCTRGQIVTFLYRAFK